MTVPPFFFLVREYAANFFVCFVFLPVPLGHGGPRCRPFFLPPLPTVLLFFSQRRNPFILPSSNISRARKKKRVWRKRKKKVGRRHPRRRRHKVVQHKEKITWAPIFLFSFPFARGTNFFLKKAERIMKLKKKEIYLDSIFATVPMHR